MKKIFLISYYFPPFGGAGAQRIVKFVKYLPDYKWNSIVLTVKEKYYQNSIDKSFLKDIPSSTKIIKTNTLPKFKNFFLNKLIIALSIPDLKIWWSFYSYKKAKRIIYQENIDIIYATGDPFSSFVFAYLLAKNTKRKFIIDFRDAWVKDVRNKEMNILGKIKKILSVPLFKLVLKKSSAIILATEGMYYDFLKSFNQYKNKLYFIDNGFDEEDFDNLGIKKGGRKFTITFSGSLYKDRDPKRFFQAINYIKNNRSDIYNKLKINFWGFFDDSFKNNYKEISDVVCINGTISHNLLINKIINSDMLLFIGENVENSHQINSSKIFEYIASLKPILALINEDMGAYKIIKQSGLGIFCDIENYIDIANKIISVVENELNLEPNLKFIKKYSRKNLTYQFSNILNKSCKQ